MVSMDGFRFARSMPSSWAWSSASTVVTIFSTARDISWRLGSPHNLWEPMLWNVTSAIVGVAVLPLVRRGALLFRDRPVRPLTAAAAFVALALVYSALHIAGMGVLRELAYAARRLETTRFRGPGKFRTN